MNQWSHCLLTYCDVIIGMTRQEFNARCSYPVTFKYQDYFGSCGSHDGLKQLSVELLSSRSMEYVMVSSDRARVAMEWGFG